MFEEAQLYSPVTAGDDGEVTVHLSHDHPGADDPAYRERRNEIAALALAWKPGQPAPAVEYSDAEQEVWRTVCRELAPKHEQLAIREFIAAKQALDLPSDGVPSLDLVSERLAPITGFATCPPPAWCRCASSTARCRSGCSTRPSTCATPRCRSTRPSRTSSTRCIGHGHLLATPTFSKLHHLTGEATHRLRDEENLRFLSRVFWFTVEFGVVIEDGELRAYGAGILSSYGEIDEFRDMELRPMDLIEMGTADYDITHYQPVLYRAESLDEVREVVGGFLASCTDESIAEMRARAGALSA